MDSESGLEGLAHELSLTALERQEALLADLRSRTSILLAATALVSSFLGGRVLAHGLSWLSASGLLCAAISILLSVYVLVPTPKISFIVLAVPAYEFFVRAQLDVAGAHRVLAYWNHEAWVQNQAVVRRLVPCFRAACGTLVLALLLGALKLALD